MQILEKYKVYPSLLSGFWLDIFVQLAQTACKPMNSVDFCLFEQAEQKSLSQNPGFGCNIRVKQKLD